MLSETLARLAQSEGAMLQREILAPWTGQGEIGVRLDGVACQLKVATSDAEAGFAVFRPTDFRTAQRVRAAKLAERRRYLDLFPSLVLILLERDNQHWLATPAYPHGNRLGMTGILPVELVESSQQFDQIEARFDGNHAWFDRPAAGADRAAAAFLREQLAAETAAPLVRRKGLTAAQRNAYALVAARVALRTAEDEEADRRRQRGQRASPVRGRPSRAAASGAQFTGRSHGPRSHPPRTTDSIANELMDSLARADAELVDYVARGDTYRVTYRVDGRQHTSAVARGSLAVRSAGICLSGRDADFDLTSLVDVIREGQNRDEIYRMGV